MTSKERELARLVVRKRRVREDFLRSITEGWSVQVSISHASCHCKSFRAMFKDDEEIQALLEKRRTIARASVCNIITKEIKRLRNG